MLKNEDQHWLGQTHPGLVWKDESITGIIEFKATYNNQTGTFMILGDGVVDEVGGLELSGRFEICVKERDDKSTSELPAVYVEGLETIPGRHVNQKDKSACLCSPLEEAEFRMPDFQFRVFLEKLVIPFLYGQVFYSLNKRWPWAEYAHGAAGILEAYSIVADSIKAVECLQHLKQDRNAWPRIRAALKQKPYLKGHTPCFCPTMAPIRRCHPVALRGALRLQQDIKSLAISLE